MPAKLAPLFSSVSDKWATPPWILEKLEQEFGPLYDPCPIDRKPGDPDGLVTDWPTDRATFVNPPYGGKEIKQWVKKISLEGAKGKTVIALVPARTGTQWWQEILTADEIRFAVGRLSFGDGSSPAPFDSALAIWDRALHQPFISYFSAIGHRRLERPERRRKQCANSSRS